MGRGELTFPGKYIKRQAGVATQDDRIAAHADDCSPESLGAESSATLRGSSARSVKRLNAGLGINQRDTNAAQFGRPFSGEP